MTRTAFISYSHQDGALVKDVTGELEGTDIVVWRDEADLDPGEYWPKRLGDAIRRSDVLILFWSRGAAKSPFVELEWNTALALKKRILPVLLDDTALPNALRAIQGIALTSPTETAQVLRKALDVVSDAGEEPEHQKAVMQVLAGLPGRPPERAAVKKAKREFVRRGWLAANVWGKRLKEVAGGIVVISAAVAVIHGIIPTKPVQGWVYGDPAVPLSGARVRFTPEGGDTSKSSTDDQGYYRIDFGKRWLGVGKAARGRLELSRADYEPWSGRFRTGRDTITLKRISFHVAGNVAQSVARQLESYGWKDTEDGALVGVEISHSGGLVHVEGYPPNQVSYPGGWVVVTTRVRNGLCKPDTTTVPVATVGLNPRDSVRRTVDSNLTASVDASRGTIAEVIRRCVSRQLGW